MNIITSSAPRIIVILVYQNSLRTGALLIARINPTMDK